jgi:CRP/FNR family transcriptional regulator, cyclic AMP receptor protein
MAPDSNDGTTSLSPSGSTATPSPDSNSSTRHASAAPSSPGANGARGSADVMEPLAALERCTDFAPGDRATLEGLAAPMTARDYPVGSVIFAQGDPSGSCYLVQSGRVQLSSPRPDGRPHTRATHGPGELVGEMTALLGRVRTSTATALEPVSAWEIPASALQAAFRGDPRLAHMMMLSVMELMVDQDAQAVRRMGLPPVQRLATILLDLQRTEGVGEGKPLSMTPAELALAAGESQTTFVMNLGRLRRAGAVETRDDHVVIMSLERLRRLAE